jgi:hypothetical protein
MQRFLKNNLALAICFGAMAMVVIAVVAWKMADNKQARSSTNADQTTSAVVQPYDERIKTPDTVFDLVLAGDTLKRGPKDIVVKQGDSVRVNITYASSDEVRVKLAGYDIITEANIQAPGAFSFIADKTGTFPFYVLSDNDGSDTQSGATAQHQIGTVTVKSN